MPNIKNAYKPFVAVLSILKSRIVFEKFRDIPLEVYVKFPVEIKSSWLR
jgi:hypothetical protein